MNKATASATMTLSAGEPPDARNDRRPAGKDIAATLEAADDGTVGDIRLARVNFINRGTGAHPRRNVAVFVDPDDPTGRSRIAAFNWNVDIGTKATQTFTIGFVVSSYYSRNSTVDNERSS